MDNKQVNKIPENYRLCKCYKGSGWGAESRIKGGDTSCIKGSQGRQT